MAFIPLVQKLLWAFIPLNLSQRLTEIVVIVFSIRDNVNAKNSTSSTYHMPAMALSGLNPLEALKLCVDNFGPSHISDVLVLDLIVSINTGF